MPILLITFITPLPSALQVVAHRGGGLDAGEFAFADQVLDRFEGQVGVDRRRAEADQQRDVVHLAGVAALDDQRDRGALLGADQVVVHGGRPPAATGSAPGCGRSPGRR